MNITGILKRIEAGNTAARGELVAATYQELRQIASSKSAKSSRDHHSVSATGLVHELSLKVLSGRKLATKSRENFYAYASKAMSNQRVDAIRRDRCQKRGGGWERIDLEHATPGTDDAHETSALTEALSTLRKLDPRKAEVVHLRYFEGLSNDEIATNLGISLATVKRDMVVAKTWLKHELV